MTNQPQPPSEPDYAVMAAVLESLSFTKTHVLVRAEEAYLNRVVPIGSPVGSVPQARYDVWALLTFFEDQYHLEVHLVDMGVPVGEPGHYPEYQCELVTPAGKPFPQEINRLKTGEKVHLFHLGTQPDQLADARLRLKS